VIGNRVGGCYYGATISKTPHSLPLYTCLDDSSFDIAQRDYSAGVTSNSDGGNAYTTSLAPSSPHTINTTT